MKGTVGEVRARKLVTVETILGLRPIPDADQIECARVRGWDVVVRKGEFQEGDPCLYFEIDSFLPLRPEYEFLLRGAAPKKMAGGIEGIRLRTIKLRGQISQGLVLPIPDGIPPTLGLDVTQQLGVVLWESPLPAVMSGECLGTRPWFIPRTDEPRIQNITELLAQEWEPGSFYVTEKLDGTSASYYRMNGHFGVCSRNMELRDGGTCYWMMARHFGIDTWLPEGMVVQGEIIGPGVQSNPLKQPVMALYVFNVYDLRNEKYLDYGDLVDFCMPVHPLLVPLIDDNYTLPADIDTLLAYADGISELCPVARSLYREGIVVRSKKEALYNGERLSFKAVSNQYLLKGDRT